MRRIYAVIFILFVTVMCMPQWAEAQSYREEGIASWYGTEFDGRPTASGEIFNSSLFTAAHPTLPFGTFLKVTNRNNNRQITVKVNDRGPFAASRILDLSKAAAEHLDMILSGVAPVIIETLPSGNMPAMDVQPAAPAPLGEPVQTPPPAPGPVYTQPAYVQPAPALTPVAPPMAEAPQAPAPETLAPATPPQSAPANTSAPPSFGPPITINVFQPPQSPVAQTAQVPAEQPPSPPQSTQNTVPPPQPASQEVFPPAESSVPPLAPSPVQDTPAPRPTLEAIITVDVPLPPPAVKFIPSLTPSPDKMYRMQIGSYKVPHNAVAAFDKLKAVGLSPAYEQNTDLYRVVLTRIRGTDVESVAYKLDKAGFREVIIREEK